MVHPTALYDFKKIETQIIEACLIFWIKKTEIIYNKIYV